MAAIEDITSVVAEAERRLSEARELAEDAQAVLKEYNAERDGSLDEDLFGETIGHIDKARRALPGEIVDWGI